MSLKSIGKRMWSGVRAGASWLSRATILRSLVILAVLAMLAWAVWSIYDYAGLKKVMKSLDIQQEQTEDLQDALIEDHEAEERDREQLERAERAAASAADLDAPGPRWLSRWLDCVHRHADRGVQACAAGTDDHSGAGVGAPRPGRDPEGASGGAQ